MNESENEEININKEINLNEKSILKPQENHRSGWMSHINNVDSSFEERVLEMREHLSNVSLLTSNTYRFNPERIRWLYLWLTTDCKVNSEIYRSRLKFLYIQLNNSKFHTFYTTKQSTEYINKYPNKIILRLSGTVPGHIVASFYDTKRNKVIHNRYMINVGNNFKDIDQIIVDIRNRLQ